MPKETLSMDTVGNIDQGALRIAFNNALKLITQDLADRPALNKARSIMLKIDLKPVIDKNSSHAVLEETETTWNIVTKAPSIGSEGVIMKPDSKGQLYFHSDLPDSPDDETIMDEVERRKLRENKPPQHE